VKIFSKIPSREILGIF